MANPTRKASNVVYLDRRRPAAEPVGTEWEDAALEVIATSAWCNSKARRLIAIALAVSLLVHALIFAVSFKYLTHHVIHHHFEPPKPLEIVIIAPVPKLVEPVPPAPAPAPAPAPREHLAHKPEPTAKPAAPAPILTAPVQASEAPSIPSPPPRAPQAATTAPASTPAAEPQPVTTPAYAAAYLDNPPPAYPLSARRLGQEGLVLVRVYVNRSGKPEQVLLAKTSGVASLNEAALNAVKQWTFVPAKRGAEPVDAWVEVPLRFRLDR